MSSSTTAKAVDDAQLEQEAWYQKESELTKQSHIDEAIASRTQSLHTILEPILGLTPGSSLALSSSTDAAVVLCQAVVAVAEATAHIAVHLQNYVQHVSAGSHNASGDEQLQLDLVCDHEVFTAARKAAPQVFATLASEETPTETPIHPTTGQYSLGFDPLDGSSIIDANFSVGSIYGIWPGKSLVGVQGRDQAASAVALYGPRTLLAIALPASGDRPAKVVEVTLVQNRTRWEVSRDSMTIAPSGKVFAPGNLRATQDHARYRKLMDYWMEHKYQLRYSGGMVPDVYHILAKQKGIFTNVSSPLAKAKLRLLYEVAPMGLLMECAGGIAMDEGQDRSVLDITIEHTDQRCGVCFGSRLEVEKYKEIMFATE